MYQSRFETRLGADEEDVWAGCEDEGVVCLVRVAPFFLVNKAVLDYFCEWGSDR